MCYETILSGRVTHCKDTAKAGMLCFATSLFRSQVVRPLTPSLLLSCPQIVTARILTSKLPCFVRELSKKSRL